MVSYSFPRQGEVWLTDFSPIIGREQAGKRPALILSRNAHNKYSSLFTVAPLTSSVSMRHHPAAVFLGASAHGAKKDSLILVFQLRAVDRSRLYYRLFQVEESALDLVWNALSDHFGRNL